MSARFCAFQASFRAFLAMIMVVFFALVAARFANLRAHFRKLRNEWRVAFDSLCQVCTHVSAFTVEPDALGHHFYVVFLQASIKAMIARHHAVMERLR
ncbi:hypothetical protein BBI11_03980 [Planococcus maritimus]|nr:hypothetical protein BBI11_03980 [Planococcus maritimus]